jgi:type II secretory pathway pseudopilin PulG
MALLVVMMLMGVMLTAGFAIASTVDTQTDASKVERVRDSTFNLAESALNAQIFALTRDWPGLGRSAQPYGACAPASGGARCPDNATLLTGGSPDLTGATWTTTVRDNGASSAANFYSDASSASQPGYDANNDGNVWVRAQAVTQGRTRTLVALVRSGTQQEDIPHAALLTDRVEFESSSRNKVIIAAGSGRVLLRCDPATATGVCLGRAGNTLADVDGNITGSTPVTGYVGAPAMTPEARARMRATAVANGTFYAGCPPEALLTGQVVWVESGNCIYDSNTQVNTSQAPGVLILNTATISFGGNADFYGVIYGVNANGLSGPIVSTSGTGQIIGGVLVDGAGRVILGSSVRPKIQFDINAFRAVASYGSAGIVQNTWREIRAG